MSAIVKLKLDQASQQVENAASLAIRFMMEDLHTLANPITPYKTGNLRTSVSKQLPEKLVGIVRWHAPYAEYQERGYTTGPVMRYTTPGTHAHFVQESLDKVIQKIPQYVRMGGLI